MLEDRLELLFFLDLQATRQENEGAQHKNESNAGHPPKFGQIPQAPLPPPNPAPAKIEICALPVSEPNINKKGLNL